MARKIAFIATDFNFSEEEFAYDFSPGFAIVQKQKNVNSLFYSIKNKYPNFKVLEVSTKSNDELGISLSAFNLKIDNLFVESIFQSSKVFMDGTQFEFVKEYSPKEAKKYLKEHNHGSLKCFRYNNSEYPLFPKSAFYDYLYIQALLNNRDISNKLIEYDAFTDIEFNNKKSLNCQARSCAIFSFMLKSNKLEQYLSSFEEFLKIYEFSDTISLL